MVGLPFAQDESARDDSMPRSAIAFWRESLPFLCCLPGMGLAAIADHPTVFRHPSVALPIEAVVVRVVHVGPPGVYNVAVASVRLGNGSPVG
jgi:hypothetical protein